MFKPKHYNKLAAALGQGIAVSDDSADAADAACEVAIAVTRMLADDDPKFNADRFYNAVYDATAKAKENKENQT